MARLSFSGTVEWNTSPGGHREKRDERLSVLQSKYISPFRQRSVWIMIGLFSDICCDSVDSDSIFESVPVSCCMCEH